MQKEAAATAADDLVLLDERQLITTHSTHRAI
jgi:hypothetical protein